MSDLNKLDEAVQFAREAKDEDSNVDSENIQTVLDEEIESEATFTISLFYDSDEHKAHLVTDGFEPKAIVEEMNAEDYMDICHSLGVEENNNYNFSLSKMLSDGRHARIFAMTKPISEYPNITISTAKEPPSTWDQEEVIDILDEVMDNNFIIVGGSGGGKTFLLNYMLKKKHANTDSKIAMIEEFNELIKPNKGTFKLTIPAAKPNEQRLHQFVTEQTNLMRMSYLYIGEIKGAEAWSFLNNLSSGTIGGTTAHGSSVRDGLDRFKNLCMLFGVPEVAINNTITKSIKYVIYVRGHKIRHIAKLSGVQQKGVFQMQDIYLNPSEEKQAKSSIGTGRGL